MNGFVDAQNGVSPVTEGDAGHVMVIRHNVMVQYSMVLTIACTWYTCDVSPYDRSVLSPVRSVLFPTAHAVRFSVEG